MQRILVLFFIIALCPSFSSAREPQEAVGATKLIEFRGEVVPFYENLKRLGSIRTVKPEFPRDEHGRRVSGSAVVGVFVDEQGLPVQVDVIESTPIPECGVKAQAAVKQWRFPKLKRDGHPTKYLVRVPVVFEERP
ncbi:hypothetical protein DB347_25380 [Opitutaceae bacterium EW11]|nr:hypothetical protein DB347_25380 [Opitutaceae bacterium EW11]